LVPVKDAIGLANAMGRFINLSYNQRQIRLAPMLYNHHQIPP